MPNGRRGLQAHQESLRGGLAQLTDKLDNSIEEAKEDDDFLSGVPAIVEAIGSGQVHPALVQRPCGLG